jgi:hypothetical protein
VTPDPDVIELRQRQPTPNGRAGFASLLVLAYTFAGFGVYWLVTGRTTVGDDLSLAGSVVWVGPIILGTLVLLLGSDRGVLRWYYEPRTRLWIAADGLRWSTPAGEAAAAWPDVGGVSSLGDGRYEVTSVFDPMGRPLAEFNEAFADARTGDTRRAPERILELRPDLFEAVEPGRPGVGCVRRDRPAATG